MYEFSFRFPRSNLRDSSDFKKSGFEFFFLSFSGDGGLSSDDEREREREKNVEKDAKSSLKKGLN